MECVFISPKTGEKCSFKARSKSGYCNSHDQQLRRAKGDVTKLHDIGEPRSERIVKRPCIFIDPDTGNSCHNLQRGRQPYCAQHYRQFRHFHGDTSKMYPVFNRKKRREENFGLYRDYILKNYPGLTEKGLLEKWKILGVVSTGRPHVRKLDKRVVAPIKFKDVEKGWGIISPLLSRHLMELKEERRLETWEHVDHIDEDRHNDHIDNLQITSKVENSLKTVRHRREKEHWDQVDCENSCVICGSLFRKPTIALRSSWSTGIGTANTCSQSCGGLYGSLLARYPFFQMNFQDLLGRAMTRRTTKGDKRCFRDRKTFVISKLIERRLSKIRKKFQDLVKEHTPHLKTSKDLSPARLRFFQERWKEYGREDWRPFYRHFLTGMLKMSEKERLEFIFREVYAFDQAHGSEMAWRLFNVL